MFVISNEPVCSNVFVEMFCVRRPPNNGFMRFEISAKKCEIIMALFPGVLVLGSICCVYFVFSNKIWKSGGVSRSVLHKIWKTEDTCGARYF